MLSVYRYIYMCNVSRGEYVFRGLIPQEYRGMNEMNGVFCKSTAIGTRCTMICGHRCNTCNREQQILRLTGNRGTEI